MENREVSAVKVICRFRPLNSTEQARGDEYLPKFKDQGQDQVLFVGKIYKFDAVVKPEETQRVVYNR